MNRKKIGEKDRPTCKGTISEPMTGNVKEKQTFKKRPTLLTVLAVCLAISLCLATSPVMGGDAVDPDADKILQSMSTYLGGLTSFIVTADIDSEILDLAGQKLQFSSNTTMTVQRPEKIHVRRQGAFADMEFIFNGAQLTLYGKNLNVYMQIEGTGTVDDAISALQVEIGLDAPGADLFYVDSYAGLSAGVVSGAYLGTAYVNGIECHHLAFRNAKTDWQLWVQAGETPLPMKYIITTKWVTGAPQYSVRFRDWNTAPQLKAGLFEFAVPEGAKKIESIQVNEVGELVIEEVQ